MWRVDATAPAWLHSWAQSQNLNTEAIDLLQLHCPPQKCFTCPETFGVLDDLVKTGKLRYCSVSVEKVEALKAIEYPNVQTVRIIFNIFPSTPGERLFFPSKRCAAKWAFLRASPCQWTVDGTKLSCRSPHLKKMTIALSIIMVSRFDRLADHQYLIVNYEAVCKPLKNFVSSSLLAGRCRNLPCAGILMHEAVTCNSVHNPPRRDEKVKESGRPAVPLVMRRWKKLQCV